MSNKKTAFGNIDSSQPGKHRNHAVTRRSIHWCACERSTSMATRAGFGTLDPAPLLDA